MTPGITLFTIAYIIILILPGVLFKRYYYYGRFARQYSSGLFADRILTTLLWGIIIQAFCTVAYCAFLEIKFDVMMSKLRAAYKMIVSDEFPTITRRDFWLIMGYLVATSVFAMFLGFVLRFFVRNFKLDLRAQNFQMTDNWYYLFTGERYAFEHRGEPNTEIEVVESIVDVLVKETDGKNNLYNGYFKSYECDPKGALQALCIVSVRKTSFDEGSKTPSVKDWEKIPGNRFVIPYSNILNINVTYIVSKKKLKKAIFRNKKVYYTLMGLLLVVVFANWVMPWFLDIPYKSKIYGFVFFHLSALFAALLINDMSYPNLTYRLPKFVVVIFFMSFLMLLYSTLRRYDFIPSIVEYVLNILNI